MTDATAPSARSSSAPTAGGPGSPRSSRSRTSAAAPMAWRATSSARASRPRASSSPTTGASPRSISRSAAAEVLLAHDIPVAFAAHAVPTQMSSYEVVERERGGRASSSPPATTPGPTTASRSRRRPVRRAARTCSRSSSARSRKATSRSSAGRSPRPRRPASSSATTRSRATRRYVRRTVDLDALEGGRRRHPRRADVGCRRGLDQPPARRRRARSGSTEIHQERNPYFGGVNPEPIRPNIDKALADIASGGHDLGLLLDGDADRAGAADEQGTFIHQLEVTGLLMYYLAEHRGLAAAGRRRRQQHLDGGATRQDLRHRRATRHRSASSTSARR